MHVHQQFAVEDGQFGVCAEGEELLVQLVAGSADNRHRAAALHALHDGADGGDVGRAACVPCAVVAVAHGQGALVHLAQQAAVFAKVAVGIALSVAVAVGHHDAAAVDALPETDGEGVARQLSLVEAVVTPAELLRRESDEATMGCQRGQGVRETEAVGQHHVGAFLTVLSAVERLSQQGVAQPRLGRDDDRFVGVPAGAGKVPASLGDVALHLLVLLGIVLLHPRVLDGTLEVEDVVGVSAQ